MTLAMVTVIAGYTVASYGWVLLQGWDITFRQWISPLNPYVWPSGPVPTVPKGHIFAGH